MDIPLATARPQLDHSSTAARPQLDHTVTATRLLAILIIPSPLVSAAAYTAPSLGLIKRSAATLVRLSRRTAASDVGAHGMRWRRRPRHLTRVGTLYDGGTPRTRRTDERAGGRANDWPKFLSNNSTMVFNFFTLHVARCTHGPPPVPRYPGGDHTGDLSLVCAITCRVDEPASFLSRPGGPPPYNDYYVQTSDGVHACVVGMSATRAPQ